MNMNYVSGPSGDAMPILSLLTKYDMQVSLYMNIDCISDGHNYIYNVMINITCSDLIGAS